MIIVTEKSDLFLVDCESSDLERLKSFQSKLRGLLESGAFAQFSTNCVIQGKEQKVLVKAASAVGSFEKLLNRVI